MAWYSGDRKVPDRAQEASDRLSDRAQEAGNRLSYRAQETSDRLSERVREAGERLPDFREEALPQRAAARSRDGQPNLAVGGLLAAGGAYDFYTKGEAPSLAAGVGAGALMIGSGLLAERDPQAAFLLGSATTGGLIAGMLPRYMETGQLMPAGAAALLGAAGLAYNGWQLWRWWDPQANKK